MLVPSLRLLWAAALVGVPAAGLVSLVPSAAAACGWILAIFALSALMDAVAGARRLDLLDIRAPQQVRLTKDVDAKFPVGIQNRLRRAMTVRIAIDMPD